MSNPDLTASYEALLIAQSIDPQVVFNIFELAEEYSNQNDCVSPSDFSDIIEHEVGVSDYIISNIILDGDIGNLIDVEQKDFEEIKEEEDYVKNLKFIDGILWGKYLQNKSLERTAALKSNQ